MVWRVVRFSLSILDSLPRSKWLISGMFDQQVVGFGLGWPCSCIQKDEEYTYRVRNFGGQQREVQSLESLTRARCIAHVVGKPIETSVVRK